MRHVKGRGGRVGGTRAWIPPKDTSLTEFGNLALRGWNLLFAPTVHYVPVWFVRNYAQRFLTDSFITQVIYSCNSETFCHSKRNIFMILFLYHFALKKIIPFIGNMANVFCVRLCFLKLVIRSLFYARLSYIAHTSLTFWQIPFSGMKWVKSGSS